MSISAINSFNPNVAFKKNTKDVMNEKAVKNVDKTPERDEFQQSNVVTPPEIGVFRLITGFLTDKQVEQINETGKLPPNAKFIRDGYGGYTISNNFFGVRVGTQKIPEGFEVKKNVLGQGVVLPKDSEGLFIK